MRPLWLLFGSGLAALGIVAAGFAVLATPEAVASEPSEPTRAPAPGAVPVVVELFTSEGCSSCPPADAVLAQLERAQDVAGAEVVPIAFHVDYWDGIGWPDPFAMREATARQRSYAALGGGSYTPQAVIDGAAQMVGSRKRAVEAAIVEAAKRPHVSVVVRTDGGGIEIDTGAHASRDAEIVLVTLQKNARVAVPRGENAGKTLDHTAIARDLRVLGPAPTAGGTTRASFKLPNKLASKDARLVVLIQERGTRRILGARVVLLS